MQTNLEDITGSLDDVRGGLKLPGWAQHAVDRGKDLAHDAVDKGKQIARDAYRTYREMPVTPTLPIKS